MSVSLSPTVIVGFGTSGARIIDGIQQKMYEVFRATSLPIFQFVSIETDKRYIRKGIPYTGQEEEENFTFLPLSSGGQGDFNNFHHLLEQLERQDRKPTWIREELARKLVAKGDGAGNVRIVGRLILRANWERVKQAIFNAQERACRQTAINETRALLSSMLDTRAPVIGNHAKVVVCGTATGGSFSGAFIDLGYLAQEALGLAQDTHPGDRIFAVMLLPPKQIMNTQNPGEQLKANTYGALVEGEYYNRGDTQYHERWPGKARPFTRNVPPFGYTYFISQEYRFGTFNPIAKLDGLYQLASLKLFCDLIGLEGMRSGILVNHFAQGRPNKFTFGLGAIMHPRYQISEFAACKLGVQLCERLLNEKEYQDKESRP